VTRRVLASSVLAAAALLLAAAPAAGHAVLLSTQPADGATLEDPPSEVTLEFNEPVTAPDGAIRVFDHRGQRVDLADARVPGDAPNTIVASLSEGAAEGTYVVAWRAVSADGHPVRGAFLFSVGEETPLSDDFLAQIITEGGERAVAVAAAVARGLTYAAVLLAAGALAFLLTVLPAGSPTRPRLTSAAVWAAAAGIGLTALGIPLQTALETGAGAGILLRPDLVTATAASNVGLSAALRAAGLAVVIIAVRNAASRWGSIVAGTGATAALASFLLVGHQVTTEPRWLVVTADTVHLGGGAVWFGGLVLLALYLRRPDGDPVTAADVVSRFSALAVIAVLAVAGGGLALAWAEVRAVRALTTPYGLTLLAKSAVVVAVLAVGAYNNRRLVPAVRQHASASREGRVPTGGSADAPDTAPSSGPDLAAPAWRRLRRTVRLEAAGLVAALVVTGALVYLQPAREAAGVAGPFVTYADLGDEHELNLVVDPNRAGYNEIHIYVTERATFRPLHPLGGAELRLSFSLPAEDVGPLVREPHFAGPGHWLHAGTELAFPGAWEIEVIVRVDDFREVRTTIPVHVNP
jgi:copper transport protein